MDPRTEEAWARHDAEAAASRRRWPRDPWRVHGPMVVAAIVVVALVSRVALRAALRPESVVDRVTVENRSSGDLFLVVADAGGGTVILGTVPRGEARTSTIRVASRTVRVSWSTTGEGEVDGDFDFEANDDAASRDRADRYRAVIDDGGARLIER